MAHPASQYPATAYEPAPLIDLQARAERERLSGPALRGFFNIIERWKVRDEQARTLLGGISNGAYYAWKREPDRVLDADVLTRISLLVGIFKALHILYGEPLADAWVSMPNRNRIFAGRSPLEYMCVGGLSAMQTLRRLLDARRGGM